MIKTTNERGYILLSVVFLTLITSFLAMMVLNANMKVSQRKSNLQLVAVCLADEQFAELENLAAKGALTGVNIGFKGDSDDLIYYYDTGKNSEDLESIKFSVDTRVSGETEFKNVKVTVSWTVDGKDEDIKLEKIIFVNKKIVSDKNQN